MRGSILLVVLTVTLVGCGVDPALRAQPSVRLDVPPTPRFDEKLEGALREVNATVRDSVVEIREAGRRRRVLYGTVIGEGLVLTKRSALPESIEVRVDDETLAAETVSFDEDHDLALLRVKGLKRPGLDFPAVENLPIGRLVICGSPDADPAAFGVVSAPVERPRAFLGVRWDRRRADDGVEITEVVPGSAAARAGLLKGDRILRVGDREIAGGDDFAGLISTYRPGDVVPLRLGREGKEVEVKARLGFRQDEEQSRRSRWFARSVSRSRRAGFPRAMQHDANLSRSECGAPLLGSDGSVVGLSIARSERVKCLALPAADVRRVVARLIEQAAERPD